MVQFLPGAVVLVARHQGLTVQRTGVAPQQPSEWRDAVRAVGLALDDAEPLRGRQIPVQRGHRYSGPRADAGDREGVVSQQVGYPEAGRCCEQLRDGVSLQQRGETFDLGRIG